MDKDPFQNTEFSNPRQGSGKPSFKKGKKGKNELKLIEKINLLLDMGDDSEETSSLIEKYTKIHRVHENTKARRRLERWASRVIVYYLITVLVILLLNYGIMFPFSFRLNISDNIIIAILTTTTVNIIGLGLIVLRGHFPNSDNGDDKK